MARPALSAARGIDIIDLLASLPGRSMTMSEIARASGVNIASCHAILSVLVERGYLLRDAEAKTYVLGPAIFAAGQAVAAGQPLLAHAEAAARRLWAELGISVAMTMTVGEEIVGVLSLADPEGRLRLIRAGERHASIPPTGGAFVAWGSEADVEAWIARSPDHDPARLEVLRRGVRAIHERGFEVLLQPAAGGGLASQMRTLAAGRETGFLHMGSGMILAETIDPERTYDVRMIAAPIFDRDGACAYNLCLGPFPAPLSGGRVLETANRLLETCVEVMHADRAN